MSEFTGVKTLGFPQSRHERQVSLSYYKLSKKIELISKNLEESLTKENGKSFLAGNRSIESILLSLKVSPDKKNLIKEYIETPFFKALTRKKSKKELKEILKEVALSLAQMQVDNCDKTIDIATSSLTVGSFFDVLNSYEFSSEQKFIVQEFSNTLAFAVLFDFYKRIFEGNIPKQIVEDVLNEFISALCVYNLSSSKEFNISLNKLNRISPAEISKLYSRLAFKKSISTLFKNADIKFKLKIIEELFIEVVTPDNLSVSAYEEFNLSSGYFKKFWNENSLFNSNEQAAIFSLVIKNEKALNGVFEYSLIKKLFNANSCELSDEKTIFQSLGFKTQTILEVLDKETDDIEFKNILKNNSIKMIFMDADKHYISDPFKQSIFQNICKYGN